MLTAVVVMLWLLLGDELPPAAGGLACAAGALCVCVCVCILLALQARNSRRKLGLSDEGWCSEQLINRVIL